MPLARRAAEVFTADSARLDLDDLGGFPGPRIAAQGIVLRPTLAFAAGVARGGLILLCL